MRKTVKKIIAFALGAALSAGALTLAACGASFTPPAGGPSAADAVESNGGFVVQKGEYIYFINGVESYEADNSYGSPVKGALMRIKEADIAAGEGDKAELVVPSVLASGDYTAGTFIYGDRVYYATPNNVRNTSGVIEKNYLDFKSAKLDGTDVKRHLQVSDNATVYRFVSVKDGEAEKIYLLYAESSNLHSYDIAEGKDTVLAKGVSAYVLSSTDKEDPYFYYTMGVTRNIDSDAPVAVNDYNQIYRVRADATEAPYVYEYDADYLKEHDGEEPYLNLGEIVLDGISTVQKQSITQFNPDKETEPLTPVGYTYTLQSYANGGLYFTRKEGTRAASLYYLDLSLLGEGWNCISGNSVKQGETAGVLTVVASAANTSKASSAAIFYHDGDAETFQHHYLYVADNNIYRADVRTDGSGEIENDYRGEKKSGNQTGTIVAYEVSSATLISRDDSDEDYDYVYYTSGGSVCRAAYNGGGRNYDPPALPYEGENNKPWQPVQILDILHASGWYNYEIVGGRLYFAESRAFGANSYNYISTVNLTNSEGKLLNNEELEAINEKYNSLMDTDSDTGLFAKLDVDHGDLADALRYYFFTGETEKFDENVKAAKDAGEEEDYLYSVEDQTLFHNFAEGKGDPAEEEADRLFEEADYKDGEKSYRTYDYFVTKIGTWSEKDAESWSDYWSLTGLKSYTPEETEEGLAGWAIALIVIAGVLALAGVGVGLWFYFKKRGGQSAPREERMAVDTTDDRSVDVYTDAETVEAPAETEAPAEEAPAETEESAETEAPVETEEPAETEAPAEPEEAPVEAETPAETEPTDGPAE